LKSGALSRILQQILAQDPIAPVLSELHYTAIDRRLLYILQTIKSCVKKRGAAKVLVDDSYSSQFHDINNS
jgi:hypothetical protein